MKKIKKVVGLLFGFCVGFYIGLTYVSPWLYSIGIDLWKF